MRPEDLIAEALRLDAEMTNAPWCADVRDDGTAQVYATRMGPCRVIVPVAETTGKDATAMAAARTLLPALARLAERQRKALEAVRHEVTGGSYCDMCAVDSSTEHRPVCPMLLVNAALDGEVT